MDTIQVQAQTLLKRYRAARLLTFLGVLLLIGGCFWAIRHTQYVLAALLFVLYGLTVRIFKIVLPNKYIYSTLTKQMDAPLFAEIIAGLRRTDANQQLSAEWYNGRFQNVVSLCRQFLSDPQVPDRHHYVFFVYLANVYFDVGDEENLRRVCDRFEEKLQSDKKAARIRKTFLRMQVFRLYLNRDFDAIEAIAGPEPKDPFAKAFRTARRARTALLQGDTENARELFVRIAAEYPKLHYSMLAQRAVEAIDSGREYREMFDDTEPTEEFPIPRSVLAMRAANKKFQVFHRIGILSGSILIAFALGLYIFAGVQDNRYEERLHTVMEEQFDDVELLTTFWPEKDGEAIDSMFICRISDGLVVGSSYRHEDEEELYVMLNAWIPSAFLETPDSQYTGSFFCTTSDYYVTGGLYHKGNALPEEYCHIEKFKVDGKTFYYVITSIKTDIEYKEEYKAKLLPIAEEEFDNVEILDISTPKNRDTEGDMLLLRTDSKLIIATFYRSEGEEQLRMEVKLQFSVDRFFNIFSISKKMEDSTAPPPTMSDYQLIGFFYDEGDDLPPGYYNRTFLHTDNIKIRFAITFREKEPPAE